MGQDVTIFSGSNLPEPIKGKTALAKTIKTGGVNRIQTNTKGTFRRIIGGEAVGKPVRGAFEAIIVDMLPEVSRVYYAKAYDPDATPTLPDCWSNLGFKPEEGAENKQAASCATCPQNVSGSGAKGTGRACRYARRIAVLLAGDTSGKLYQFNIPAKSLFGKGDGTTQPFEAYCRLLLANDFSPDRVVTKIAYDEEEETMVLQFSPVRPITKEELALVEAAQADPATRSLIELTVAAADGAKPKAKPEPKAEEETDEGEEESPWGDDDDAPAEEQVKAEPTKRAAKPKAKATTAKPKANPKLAEALSGWADDDEDEED